MLMKVGADGLGAESWAGGAGLGGVRGQRLRFPRASELSLLCTLIAPGCLRTRWEELTSG